MKHLTIGEFLSDNTSFIAQDYEKQFNQFFEDNKKEFKKEFSIKQDDRLVLATLLKKIKPKVIVETGTNWGATTVLMALNTNAFIYTIDIGDSHPGPSQVSTNDFGASFKDTPIDYRIVKINKSTFNIYPNELPPADLWFIDSDHSLETVKHETSLAMRNMAKRGGVIIYHDARNNLTYESDVYKYLTSENIDATIIETQCGLAVVLIDSEIKTTSHPLHSLPLPITSPVATQSKTNIVGLMMTKNEADIIGPVLKKWKEWNIPIVAVDGSDDGTYDLLKIQPNITVMRDGDLFGNGVKGSLDWVYQLLLERKRELYGLSYCCIALGDELWHHNPHKIVNAMSIEGATYARGESMQFFLHTSDKDNWDFVNNRWKTYSLPHERLKWYSPGWQEDRIFLDDGKCSYGAGQSFDTMPRGSREKRFSRNFIYSHYPIRDPVQIVSRAKDRVERSYQPFYQHALNESVFYETFPGIDKAIRFNGNFGEYEKNVEDLV